MIGGLLSNTSRLALVAAASLIFAGGVAMPSAKAADLGGDCCADLEERVAELEATTARKGNRKMSVTVSGQVDKVVLWYDDGKESHTYYGLDNRNSSTRLFFNGSAKVTPKVTMGFEIMLDTTVGGVSSSVSQFNEDGPRGGNQVAIPNAGGADADVVMRRSFAWVEHADLGRITVGHLEASAAGVYGMIDLTPNVTVAAGGGFGLLNGGFFLRGPGGQVYNMTWANIVDPSQASSDRADIVRYDSPDWHGFIFSSFVGEASDYYGSNLKYAGEYNGFRLAGALGYEHVGDRASASTGGSPIDPGLLGRAPNINGVSLSLSAMHVPTGIFVQGYYNSLDYGGNVIGAASGYWNESTTNKKPTDNWLIQAGISKNFFGYGATSVYGEYGKADDWGADITNGAGVVGRTYAPVAGFATVSGVTSTEVNVWGMGITQRFDAATTDLYLGYRHMEANINCLDAGAAVCAGGVAVGGVGTVHKLATEPIDVIVMGARVLF